MKSLYEKHSETLDKIALSNGSLINHLQWSYQSHHMMSQSNPSQLDLMGHQTQRLQTARGLYPAGRGTLCICHKYLLGFSHVIF